MKRETRLAALVAALKPGILLDQGTGGSGCSLTVCWDELCFSETLYEHEMKEKQEQIVGFFFKWHWWQVSKKLMQSLGVSFPPELFVYRYISEQHVLACFKINHLHHAGTKEVEQHFTFSIWHVLDEFGS